MTLQKGFGVDNALLPSLDNTASLAKRFVAFLIDTFFIFVAILAVMNTIGIFDVAVDQSQTPEQVQAAVQAHIENLSPSHKTVLALSPFVTFFLLNGFLLARSGQTLGKRIIGLAIVTLEGNKPDFTSLIVWRYLTQWTAGMIPGVGILLRLVDVCFVFRPDRRCIHDVIAKTRVIDLSIPVSANASKNTLIV